MGVNFTNADRLSVTARDTALDQMKVARVKAIRTPLAQQWGAGSFQPSVEVVKAAWARGISFVVRSDLDMAAAASLLPGDSR